MQRTSSWARVPSWASGLIGERLPLDALLSGVDKAAASLAATPEAGLAAATAVLTTDTVPKQAAVRRAGWTVGGFAKGAGMVAPSLALILYRPDVLPLFEGRPALELADRLLPEPA